MSWADEAVPDVVVAASPVSLTSANTSARPDRRFYVPPHLRNRSSSSSSSYNSPASAADSEPPSSHGFPLNSGRRSRRFREPKPLDIADKLDALGISEQELQQGSSSGGEGINFDAYEDIPVDISGVDAPPPVNTFAEIDLGEVLNLNIKRCKYVKPTPVQRHAIPISLAGRDLMACAQTGSGKTAAFCFPIIRGILTSCTPQTQHRPSRGVRTAFPYALILSPTRELACQVPLFTSRHYDFLYL